MIILSPNIGPDEPNKQSNLFHFNYIKFMAFETDKIRL